MGAIFELSLFLGKALSNILTLLAAFFAARETDHCSAPGWATSEKRKVILLRVNTGKCVHFLFRKSDFVVIYVILEFNIV